MKTFSVNDVKIERKKVLYRSDLNIEHLSKKDLARHPRFLEMIEGVKQLLQNNNQVCILSHLGRPKAAYEVELSLQKYCTMIEKKIKRDLRFLSYEQVSVGAKLFDNSVLTLVENLRFFPQELDCEISFAQYLVEEAEVFVMDAFAVAHRNCASVTIVPQLVPSVMGDSFFAEKQNLDLVIKKQNQNLLIILGGAKFFDKIELLLHFVGKSKHIFLAGEIANIYLKFLGYKTFTCASNNWDKYQILCTQFQNKLARSTTQLVLPVDFITPQGEVDVQQADTNLQIGDLGKKSLQILAKLVKSADTIFWNGPIGKIEIEQFASGSKFLWKLIQQKQNSIRVVGGGDTNKLFTSDPSKDKNFHTTDSGGAMLHYLAHESLPALEALHFSSQKFGKWYVENKINN